MRKLIASVLAVAAASLMMLSPAHAKRDRRQINPLCDPFTMSARAATTPAGLLIGGFDANGDARVDRNELKAGIDRMFMLADRNRDGQLSLIELSEWSAVWLGGPSAIPGRFDFDRDQNDIITRGEFAAELTRLFNEFDTDGNGVVDRAELLTRKISRRCVNGQLLPPRDGRDGPQPGAGR